MTLTDVPIILQKTGRKWRHVKHTVTFKLQTSYSISLLLLEEAGNHNKNGF